MRVQARLCLRCVVAGVMFVSLVGVAFGSPEALRVGELKCEMRSNPLGIDTKTPRLGWVIESPRRAQRQSAFQVLAATTISLLEAGKADLWDSGKRAGEQSIQIPYEGKPLASNQQVYWTVRVWDAQGNPSQWATPASWTTALLDSSQWSAKWIAPEQDTQEERPPIMQAKWLWEADSCLPTSKTVSVPANLTRYFRRTFTLPANASIVSATLAIAADNEACAYINSENVCQTKQWNVLRQCQVEMLLKPGQENVLTVAARNDGDGEPNAAGLLAGLSIHFSDGESTHILTDESWQAAATPLGKGWPQELAHKNSSETQSATWKPARVLGGWGTAPWHKLGLPHEHLLPVFHKAFSLEKPVRRALVHVCGLGQYKLYVNGQSASATFLDPPWSTYEKTAYYNTLDVTSLLRPGQNAFGVILGKGCYNILGDRRVHGNLNEYPLKMILQAQIEYADGSTQVVASDGSWKWTRGPMTHNAILGGTDYDARRMPKDFATPALDSSTWKPAEVVSGPAGELTAAGSPPLRTFEELHPKSIDEPEPGHFVYDFAQNASAAPRIKVKGKAGATLRLTYAEQRHGSSEAHNDGKGLIDQAGIGTPAYLEYTLKGDPAGEEWFSDFFYSGYQYIELTGAVPEGYPNPEGKPVVTQLVSVHVHAATEPAGNFSCSDAMYDRIDRMVDWSVRSNLGHVLTDCPHREKLGWLEVPWLMWASIAYRYDLSSFAPKVARDIRDSQGSDGVIFTVAPNYPAFQGGFRYTPEWGAAGVMIPWYAYQWYGDTRTLQASYDSMKRFVDYMRNTSDNLVPKPGLGDWYDYGHGEALGASRFTPTDLSAMSVFHECAEVVSQAAKVLGKAEDEKAYGELAGKIAQEFNRRYYDASTGEYKNTGSPQTANAMALVTGIVESSQRSRVCERIVADMKKRGNMQTSGDVGYRFLLRALADMGQHQAIFDMLARTDLGSYAYLVNAGWTSLPESWNAYKSYSMNHCMLGHIQEWFVHDLAGIQLDPKEVAFKRFVVKPTVSGSVTSASAEFRSPYGLVKSSWKREGKSLEMDVTVPVNTSAHVYVPAAGAEQVSEGGKSAAQAEGVKYLCQEDGCAVFEVGSGSYRLTADLKSQIANCR